MKKIFLVALFFLAFFLNNINAFEILDQNYNPKIYFTLGNDNVIVRSDANYSNLTINYKIYSTYKQAVYNFSSCSLKFCSFFNISDMIEENNDTITTSTRFQINVAGKSEYMYLDIENPSFTLSKSNLNLTTKKVDFSYSYSDVTSNVTSVKLYEVSGSNNNFIAELINTNNYSFTPSEQKKYTFKFVIYDLAGNFAEKSAEVDVSDLFAPQITDYYVVKDGKDYKVTFSAQDNNKIYKYELVQDSFKVEDVINLKTVSEKTVTVPFTSGEFILRVYDEDLNYNSVKLDLGIKILNTYSSKYSSSQYFKFTSNADSCYLSELNSKKKNEQFDKSSDEFKLKLDINENLEVDVGFYCEKTGLREYFERTFVHDTEDPKNTVVSGYATDDGFLTIEWDEAKDKQSDVEYMLYRDDERVYHGSKLSYTDYRVLYPSQYTYYVKVYDIAGNNVKSNKITLIPVKKNINFMLLSDFDDRVFSNVFNFSFQTEKDVRFSIFHKFNDNIVYSYDINKTNEDAYTFVLNLKEGQNIIQVVLNDNFGNSITKAFNVIYQKEDLKPIVSDEDENLYSGYKQDSNGSIVSDKDKLNDSGIDSVSKELSNEDKRYAFWLLVIVIIIAIAYFIRVFVIGYDIFDIEKKVRSKSNRSYLERKKKSVLDQNLAKNVKRPKDELLSKELMMVKRQRLLRQKEMKKEELLLKRRAEKDMQATLMHKQKIDEINNAKKQNIDMFKQNTDKKIFRRDNKNKEDYDLLLSKKKDEISLKNKDDVAKRGLFEDFSAYINKVKGQSGWNSSSEYIQKEEPVKEKSANEDKNHAKEEKTEQKVAKFDFKSDFNDYINKIFDRKKRRTSKDVKSIERQIERELERIEKD